MINCEKRKWCNRCEGCQESGAIDPVDPADPEDPVEISGVRGRRGKRGHSGKKGDPGDPASIEAYGYIYKDTAQEICSGDCDRAVIFDKNGAIHNIGHNEPSRFVKIKKSGKYEIRFSVSTKQNSQFAISLNGTIISETRYGVGCGGQQNNGDAILKLKKGDILALVDATICNHTIIDNKLGGKCTVVSASIILVKIT